MDKLNKFLSVIRILDEEGKLSLTNISVMVALTKLALVPSGSILEVGALAMALLTYSYKKHVNKSKENEAEKVQQMISEASESLTEELAKVKSKISQVSLKVGLDGFKER